MGMTDYIPPEGRHFDYPDCHRWERTFAWLPKKTISGKIAWLRTIYKQHYYRGTPGWGQNYHMWSKVEYAEFIDVMRDNYEQG